MIQSKITAVIFSIVITSAVIWPVIENFKKKPKDDFPLSYYPMFTEERKPVQLINYFIGYDSMNNRYSIPYKFVGTGGFNQVRKHINDKVRKRDYEKITRKTAERVARSKEFPYKNLTTIQLARGAYHFDNYFRTGNKIPIREKILLTQKIER